MNNRCQFRESQSLGNSHHLQLEGEIKTHVAALLCHLMFLIMLLINFILNSHQR